MKVKISAILLLSASTVLAQVQNIDSQVAKCGAVVSVAKSGNRTILNINNQNCSEVSIRLPGAELNERLNRGAVANLDISNISGAKLPVSIDNEFLTLNLQSGGQTNVVVQQQTAEQKRLTELQIQEAERKRAEKDAAAAVVGTAIVVGTGAVITDQVVSGEH